MAYWFGRVLDSEAKALGLIPTSACCLHIMDKMLTRMLSHNRTYSNIGQFHSLDGYQEDRFLCPQTSKKLEGHIDLGLSVSPLSSVSMTVIQYQKYM